MINNNLSSLTPLIKKMFLLMHPVGSLYFSTTATSPQTTFGGSWSAFGAGRFPVFYNGSDAAYNKGEKTGGSKTSSHTHNANNTGSTKLTLSQIPSHNHKLGSFGFAGENTSTNRYTVGYGQHGARNIYTDNNGSGGGHSHTTPALSASASTIPPFIVIYAWKRTA